MAGSLVEDDHHGHDKWLTETHRIAQDTEEKPTQLAELENPRHCHRLRSCTAVIQGRASITWSVQIEPSVARCETWWWTREVQRQDHCVSHWSSVTLVELPGSYYLFTKYHFLTHIATWVQPRPQGRWTVGLEEWLSIWRACHMSNHRKMATVCN